MACYEDLRQALAATAKERDALKKERDAAYKAGFEDGYRAGREDAVTHAHWVREEEVDGDIIRVSIRCSNCLTYADVNTPACPICAAVMDEPDMRNRPAVVEEEE